MGGWWQGRAIDVAVGDSIVVDNLSELEGLAILKITERWEDLQQHGQLTFEGEFFDDGCHEEEQFPREFVAAFNEVIGSDGKKYAEISVNGKQFGAPLRDNVSDDDFYRFHDVFHLSYVVVLGWSPIARRFLDCKRKSDDKKDEIEDGGRAAVIDEAIQP